MDEFEQVYKQYFSLVYRYVLSLCGNPDMAEEVSAETFYNAYLHIGRFRGNSTIETWLCSIAKNALRKELKRRNRYKNLDEAFTDTLFVQFELVDEREIACAIYTKAESLRDPYKEVFKMRVIGNLPFKQIAEVYGKTESWAKITYYRAKAKIIEMMGEIK